MDEDEKSLDEVEDPIEVEGAPKKLFDQYELSVLNGEVIDPAPGEIFQSKQYDLAFKAYSENPERFMSGLEAQLVEVDERIGEATSEEELTALVDRRNLILQTGQVFPETLERKKAEEQAMKKWHDEEFRRARESGDWSKILAIRGVIPADELNESLRQENLEKAKKKIIKTAIETNDFSLASKFNALANPKPPEPSLEEMLQEDHAKEQRQEMIKELCAKARASGDWSRVLKLAGLPH